MRRAALLVPMLVLAAGCDARPRAPALSNSAVYDHAAAGMRFAVPERWRQVARNDHPPESSGKERLMVRYQGPPGEKAVFEVTAQEAPEPADALALLRAPSHSLGEWTADGNPEPLTINGVAATRYRLKQQGQLKESVVFRRGSRLYFLTLVAPPEEVKPREHIRALVASVTWSG